MKDLCGVALENEDVYMNTTFEEFTNQVVVKGRGGGAEEKDVEFDKVSVVVFFCSLWFWIREHTYMCYIGYNGGSSLQIELNANNRDLVFPHQLFINGEFVDSTGSDQFHTINPTTEKVIIYYPYH